MPSIRTSVGVLVLSTMVACIGYAQLFTESRVFCFAMFSSVNQYDIRVLTADGRWLTPDDIYTRYQRRSSGVEMRSIQHVKNVIVATEATAHDRVRVFVAYRTNGHIGQHWTHP